MSDLHKKLGILLKEERERQNILIDDLSERLKITVPNLQSIEGGTTDGLPSELYFSLFAKSYAEALGIDYTRTVEAIKADIEEPTESPESSKNNEKKKSKQNSENTESESQLLKKGGIALAVIVGLFLVFVGVNKIFFNSSSAGSNEEGTPIVETQIKAEEDKELDEAYANYDWDSQEYTKSEKIILTLTPKAESWSAIFADGDTAIYRTLRVGRTYTAEADYRLTVSIGVPSVVTTKLNGKEVDLRDKDTRRIYKVLINQMNIDSYLNPEEKQPEIKTSQTEAEPEPIAENNESSIDINDTN